MSIIEIERQRIEKLRQIMEGLEKGREALSSERFQEAISHFEKVLGLDHDNPEAIAGLKEAYYKAGEEAERARHFGKAQEYYRALLDRFPDDPEAKARLRALDRKLKLYRIAGGVVLGFIIIVILAQLNKLINWPPKVCRVPQVGKVLCTPTPTPTATPTATPTSTPTFTPTPTSTPTFTPTPTPTSTPTPTPTATPTPTPYLARIKYEYVSVYTKPTGSEEVTRVMKGTVWHLCAKAGERYLVAQDYCHKTTPLGWVNARNMELLFIGEFPPALTTPMPSSP